MAEALAGARARAARPAAVERSVLALVPCTLAASSTLALTHHGQVIPPYTLPTLTAAACPSRLPRPRRREPPSLPLPRVRAVPTPPPPAVQFSPAASAPLARAATVAVPSRA